MKVKIVLRRISGNHVIYLHPEEDRLRWYITEVSELSGKTIKPVEKQMTWDAVLKSLQINEPTIKDVLWSATTLDLGIENDHEHLP